MNSIATAYVTDFHRRLWPGSGDRAYLRIARLVTAAVGIVGAAIALVLASTDIRSIYSLFLEVLGLTGGTLSGLFVLGIFTRRASAAGALAGALASVWIVFSIRATHPLNVYAYAPIGMGACVLIGWVLSFACPGQPRDLHGLTIHSFRRRSK